MCKHSRGERESELLFSLLLLFVEFQPAEFGFIACTDTLLRTQTITQKERYIPTFYRFCTITLATLATIATLTFSIHLHINP